MTLHDTTNYEHQGAHGGSSCGEQIKSEGAGTYQFCHSIHPIGGQPAPSPRLVLKVKMASRELRSRRVEAHQEDLEIPAGENVSGIQGAQPKDSGSLSEPSAQPDITPQEVALETQPYLLTVEQEFRQNTPPVPSTDPADELKQMLAGFMTVIQQSRS
jgi:hypothetical protein